MTALETDQTGALQPSDVDSQKRENSFENSPLLEEFFGGKTQASGLVEDRFGNKKRQFVAEIIGCREGAILTLKEHFVYDDGEAEDRYWRIERVSDDTYRGVSPSLLGPAIGRLTSDGVHWRYAMPLKFGPMTLGVQCDDRMYLQDDGLLVGRTTISKFGLRLAEVTIAFFKADAGSETRDETLKEAV